MELHNLPAIARRPKKRKGQGIGSGKGGHTSSRGQKGQKARGKVPEGFEGTKNKKSFLKRLPFMRGKGRFKAWGTKYKTVNLQSLEGWPEKTPVTVEALVQKGLIDKKDLRVKIVGMAKGLPALTVRVAISSAAKAAIVKAGGIIEVV